MPIYYFSIERVVSPLKRRHKLDKLNLITSTEYYLFVITMAINPDGGMYRISPRKITVSVIYKHFYFGIIFRRLASIKFLLT